jgi:hypothetical protein
MQFPMATVKKMHCIGCNIKSGHRQSKVIFHVSLETGEILQLSHAV